MMTDTTPQVWRNRITGYGQEAPEQLLANPLNYRVHPQEQQDALLGILNEVGFVQNVIVNKHTGFVVDGHLRVALALQQAQAYIPVTYVELTPEEEREVLLFLDRLTAMATYDKAKLAELLQEVETLEPALQGALAKMAADAGILPPEIEFKEYDESVADDVQYLECPNCGHKWPK